MRNADPDKACLASSSSRGMPRANPPRGAKRVTRTKRTKRTNAPAQPFAFAHPGGGLLVGGQAYATLEDARRRAKKMSARRRRALVVRDMRNGAEHSTEAGTAKRNPPATVQVRHFGGKQGHLVGGDVLAVEYRNVGSATHAAYRHDFKSQGIELWALVDGSLLIRHPKHRLWDDFNVSDNE